MPLLFSDLHLKPETEAICFDVLSSVVKLAHELHEDRIIFLGDFWDVRYSVPVHLLNRVHAFFREERMKYPRGDGSSWRLTWDILPGNHDQIDVNGAHAMEVFASIPGVRVHTEPHWSDDGLWLPYRKDPRVLAEIVAAGIPPGKPPVAYLHHGIVGAWMNGGKQAGDMDGLQPSTFSGFRRVFLGHWHGHQVIQNCVYVGSQWQVKADEVGQSKVVLLMANPRDPEVCGNWEAIPISIGRKFHKAFGEGLPALQPGDIFLATSLTDPALLAQAHDAGAVLRVQPVPKESALPRLGAASMTLREQAHAYALTHAQASGVSVEDALTIFDEVTS